jgi:O-antigen/teichoic acid export membrane protein
MDSNTVRRRVVSGFAWQGATKAIVQAASWLSTLYVARLLAPSDYGVMAAAMVFIGFLLFVTEMGLSQGLIQRKDSNERLEDGIFYLSLLVGIALYAAIYAGAPWIADFYRMPVLTALLRVAGLGVIFASLVTVPLAIAMRRLDFRHRSLVQMAAGFASVIVVVSMAVQGFGVWSLVGGTLAMHATLALGFLPVLRRFPKPRLNVSETLPLLSYGLQVTGNRFLNMLWSRSDAFIIGRVLGERLLGFYSMAYQLSAMPLEKVGSIFNYVLFPAVSRLQEQPEETRRLFLDVHRVLLLIGFPLLAGLALTAPDAVSVLLTEKWRRIVPLLQGLCLVNMLRLSGMTLPPVLLARGRPGLMMRYNLGMLLLLPLAIYLSMDLGVIGAVYAWIVVYPLMYIALLVFTLRELNLGLSRFLASMLPATSATGIMIAVVVAVQHAAPDVPLQRLLLSMGAGALAYVLALIVLFRGRLRDFLQEYRRLKQGRTSPAEVDPAVAAEVPPATVRGQASKSTSVP